ncbi:hypothetical protein [Streptomyces misionensis]|uniref:hypothetical protein n=1 Tax=Streptomyces misionensis TaxID=67331 RepID=UPI0033AD9FE2
MPVEPVPCPPEGGGAPVDVTTCCSPAIASTPLCRADGSTVLLLVRSGCAECGQDAGDPAVAGWIDAATGAFTAGQAPADAGPCDTGGCCSPSITSTPMCRQDGSTVLVVVRSGCAECEQDAGTPAVVGWLDPLSGAFTPGPAPLDAGPCDTGCVDTVCRTRCDDTNADGAADDTYTELWCIKPDGTATLILTYQDDPSTPYTPVAPLDCEHGCLETETLTLCDDSGAFLRRMTWLNGVAVFEDFALDGITPHLVTGTVRVCAEGSSGPGPEPCAEQTTPAATLGLCLPDGTPLAVLVTRDCAGTVTQDGWLNLTTGTYTSGPPPAGAAACGDSRAFELAGLLCDLDPASGDVLGLVLLEYAYNTDGSLDSVRLVDPATGDTYTLQGELRRCPGGGQEQPEQDLTVLCDAAADGTVTSFVRDFRRDPESGQITGHTDYGLDGAPYTPAGTVGVCQPPQPEAEPCRDTSSTLLCDTAATDTLTVFDPANRPGADGWEVVSFTGANPGAGPEAALPYPARYGTPLGYPALGARADQNAGSGSSWAGYDAAPVRWILRKTFTAPEDGVAVAQSVGFRGDGGARVRINGVDAGMYGQWNQPATSGTAQIPVTAGPNIVEIEVRDVGGVNNVVGRLDIALPHTTQFMRRQTVDCATGDVIATHDTTLDGQPYTVTGEVGQCEPVAECCEPPAPEKRVDVEMALLCVRDQAGGEITRQVIAERVYDDQSGDLLEQRLTALDGASYVLPAGAELVKCPEPDRIVRTICLAQQGEADFRTNPGNAASGVDAAWEWSTSADGPWYPMYDVQPLAAWSVTDTDTTSSAHWVAPHQDRTVCPTAGETSPPVTGTWYTRARWTLPADADPDTIRISASVLNADNWVDRWRLNDGAWQPVATTRTVFIPPAYTIAPSQVPGARAGENQVVVQLHEASPAVSCPNGNQAGMMLHVTATYEHELVTWTQVIEDGRIYYLDENGQRQDAIPDGYRQVSCGGGDGGCCPAVTTDTLTLCDTAADGTVTSFLRHLTYTEGAPVPAMVDTALDGTTPYTPSGTVSTCGPGPEPCRSTGTLLVCDLPTEGTPAATVTDTDPTPYYPYPTGAPAAGGQTLWDGGTLNLPAGTAPQPGTLGTVNSLAATVQAPRPACDIGKAHVTVSLNVRQAGPDDGCGQTGHLRLFNGTTQTALTVLPANTPAGWFGTLTVEADVPAADLAAGAIAVALALDAYDDNPAACTPSPRRTGWELSSFTTAVEYDQTGCARQFLRNVVTDCETGAVIAVTDTTLDGQPYTVTGDVGQCQAAGETGAPPCEAQNVLSACRCDDTDGDGLADTEYVELLAVDCTGTLTSVGTYTPDLAAPYTPVAPAPCETSNEGAEPALGVQAGRVELSVGATWDAATVAALRSVTATAHTGTGRITTADGTSTIFQGETVTWSTDKETDALLAGPLTITAVSGIVTVTYTRGVNL